MGFSADMTILEFDSFETAFPVQPGKESAVKRRFMTLFAQEGEQAQVGGTSYVCKAQSFKGETFAVKRLLASAGIPKDANLTPEDTARITQGHAAAFYEEYKNQLLVSRMRGFPKLYGYGMIGDDPAIVMEWVEGVSLRDIARDYAARGEAVPAKTIAALGASVLEVLDTAGRLDNTLAHRDISPANVMVRTEEATLDEQVERGFFDVCLIDFGSASAAGAQDASFTMVSQVWRNGTPEYAPPEMLTQDIPHIDELRKSQAIDVFALCSVLYELYAGHTPWRVGDHPELSPFRLKTERAPESVPLRQESDAPFVDALLAGLEIEQANRPTVQELLAAMSEFAPLPAGEAADSSAAPRLPRGYTILPSLYTPDSTHLKVASESEGGKRAGEDIAPFERPPSLFTRRSLIIGGLALAAATVGGVVTARTFQGEPEYDFSSYPVTDSLYEGDALHPVMKVADSAWVLRDVKAAAEIAIGSGGREPGKFVGGLMRAYDPASGRYGFMTAVEQGSGSGSGKSASGSSAGEGGYACVWRVLPRYAQAGDFSFGGDGASGASGGSGGASGGSGRLAAVKDPDSGLWGYIDVAGTWQLEPAFDRAGRFASGFAPACPAGSRRWGLIDEAGNQAASPRFVALGTCSETGLIAAAEQSGAHWGFVETDGDWAIPDDFARVRRFTEGLAACRREADGLWEYIDETGATAIEARFADAYPFADELAPAQDADTRLWGLIDAEGNWRVEPRFLSLGEKVGDVLPAHGSPAFVYDIHRESRAAWDDYAALNSDWLFDYGFVNESGEWVVKPIYGDVLIRDPEQ